MDLGICPKCGSTWIKGDEQCVHCGYTAIGAGLSRLPKKKKRKIKPYREPGGATPLLSFTLVVVLLGGGYYYKPWSEDWDWFRSLMGAGRVHPIRGVWDVVETVQRRDSTKNFIDKETVAKGAMLFDGKENVKISISAGDSTASATGHYVVDGLHLKIFGLTPTGESTLSIPKSLDLTLAWCGPDDILAAITESDVLYLKRQEGGTMEKMLHMSLSDSKGTADTIRGMITQAEGKGAGDSE